MLIISALVGGLLGVERELKVQVLAGTRTFMFASMLAALSVYVSDLLHLPGFVLVSFFGFLAITTILAIVKNFRSFDYGVTTPIAFIIAYILGTLVGLGLYFEAIAGSIIVTSFLIFKKYTIWLSETLTHDEMRSALEFGIIAFVLYPVAPTDWASSSPSSSSSSSSWSPPSGSPGSWHCAGSGPKRVCRLWGPWGGLSTARPQRAHWP